MPNLMAENRNANVNAYGRVICRHEVFNTYAMGLVKFDNQITQTSSTIREVSYKQDNI